MSVIVRDSPSAPRPADPLVRQVADILARIEINYEREGTGPGSRFAGRMLQDVQAEAAVRAVRRAACAGSDPLCPCQDGDTCNYRDDPVTGTRAMRVVQARTPGRPRHELWTPASRSLPFASDRNGPVHAGRQCLNEFAWHAHCDNSPVWLLGGDVNCPECLTWLREEAAP